MPSPNERPKLGDKVKYRRGGGINEGIIIAVSEVGVHYLVRTPNGSRYRLGLSRIVKIIEKNAEKLKKEARYFREM